MLQIKVQVNKSDYDNVKKVEQEELEKLARKGPSSGEQPSPTTGSAASDVKADAGPTESASASVSTDNNRNYAVLAGAVAALGGLGWYHDVAGERR
uniref:Uncharacterized protein n=1 Tax=Zea mays TaxID=4577 RepID=A0A804MI16_MAIZE